MRLYTRKTTFPKASKREFSPLLSKEGQQVLTKRSTSVDQNLESDRGMSQFSVAIFIVSRIYLEAEKAH